MSQAIVCYECGVQLRNDAGVDLVNDIFSNQAGEDVCKACHDKNTEPYLITDDSGDVIGFHNRDCGWVEVEYIDYPFLTQPERIDNSMLPNDVWWLYEGQLYSTADMQGRLLEDADSDRKGGPVLINRSWYWSPVFDADEWAKKGSWSL